MRAEIKTGNLLTGQKYVAVDVHSGRRLRTRGLGASSPPIFPTAPGALDEIQDSIGSIAKKLDKVPFDQISARLVSTMASLDQTLKSTRPLDAPSRRQYRTASQCHVEGGAGGDEKCQGGAALKTRRCKRDLSATLLQLSRAAKSVSALVEYLERHPEALIRGKPEDRP